MRLQVSSMVHGAAALCGRSAPARTSQAEVTRPPDAVSRAEANAERRVGQREGGVQQTYEHRCHQPDLFAHRRLAAGGDPRLRRSALLCAREVAHRRGRHARTHLTGRALPLSCRVA